MTLTAENARKQPSNRENGGTADWGSRLLIRHYQIIGMALVAFEEERESLLSKAEKCQKTFREGVAFVPVEILESYLDDLMDLSIEEEKLFLDPGRHHVVRLLWRSAFLAVGSSILVMLLGNSVYAASCIALLAASLYLPFWQRARGQVVRRLQLSRVVSREVNRRRGRDDSPFIPVSGEFNWKEFFSRGRTTSSLPGAALGDAFACA